MTNQSFKLQFNAVNFRLAFLPWNIIRHTIGILYATKSLVVQVASISFLFAVFCLILHVCLLLHDYCMLLCLQASCIGFS